MRKQIKSVGITIIVISLFVILGCSSQGNLDATSPSPEKQIAVSGGSHNLWGMWQFVADTDSQTVDVVQLRSMEMHLNAIPFLEPPALVNLSLENLQFNGNLINADIGLRHPFLGLTEFSGFDVCGILITNGSLTGFSDPDLRMAGDGDTRLLNPDGYTRWWNPAEFPVNDGTIFGYTDGLLGAPDSVGEYNSTLNAYKYFCDDLDDADDPLSDVTIENRGLFSAGQKNIRHYTIELGNEGLVFNYAVDASWIFPTGDPPFQAPGDFPPAANRAEAYRIEITEVENTLYNDGATSGGDLELSIDVYDHFNTELNTVIVESPGNFDVTTNGTPSGGGAGYSTYELDVTDAYPITAGEIDLLITIESNESDYQNLLPGETISAYFVYATTVDNESPVGDYTLEWDNEVTIISNQPTWNDISPALAVETDNETVVAWNADNPNTGSPAHYQNFSRSSNGLTWPNGTNCFPGGSHKGDFVKCAAGTNGTSFSTFATVFSSGNPPFNPFGTRNENYSFGGNYCFPHHDLWSNIEMFVPQNGRVYVFTDYNVDTTTPGSINVQHSNGANTLDGGVSWGSYAVFPVTSDGFISHSRSVADTSGGAIHLVYYAVAGNAIRLVSSTDGATGEAWGTPVIVNEDSGHYEFFDPSLAIDDDDEFYATWQYRNNTDNSYEIALATASSSAGPFSSPVLVRSTTSEVHQPAVTLMNYPDGVAVFVSWVEGSTTFVAYSLDGENFSEPITVQMTYSPTQQADCIVDHLGNLQVVWSQQNSSWDVVIRRAVLVEN